MVENQSFVDMLQNILAVKVCYFKIKMWSIATNFFSFHSPSRHHMKLNFTILFLLSLFYDLETNSLTFNFLKQLNFISCAGSKILPLYYSLPFIPTPSILISVKPTRGNRNTRYVESMKYTNILLWEKYRSIAFCRIQSVYTGHIETYLRYWMRLQTLSEINGISN